MTFAVLRSALFGSTTTAHGGPTLFGITGLVFAEGPNVGKNTVPQLAATVRHLHRGERVLATYS